jgi:molybdopterin molybdotransferase
MPDTTVHVQHLQDAGKAGKKLLSLSEAREQILNNTARLPEKKVLMIDVNGHYLAESITAKFKLPPFDNSAVDGYGVLLKDVESASEKEPVELRYLGEVKAGSAADLQIEPRTCIKILTGAPIPSGVEAVVMREYCDLRDGIVYVTKPAAHLENIRIAGEEFDEGAQVLPAGILASPPVVGLLANFGYERFSVIEKPRVAVVVTGDELIKPGQPLAPGQIYDTNSFSMRAALLALGIREIKIIHVKDTVGATRNAFEEALNFADAVISSGGVSVGDYDYVKEVLEQVGVKTVFWGVKVKPGKPVYFGVVASAAGRGNKLIFGLPGNPVSLLVTYHQLVKPALAKMMGKVEQKSTAVKFRARMLPDAESRTRALSSKKAAGRLDLVRGTLSTTEEGLLIATPTTGQDSHMLSGLAAAECFIHIEAGQEAVSEGSPVTIEPIDWHA